MTDHEIEDEFEGDAADWQSWEEDLNVARDQAEPLDLSQNERKLVTQPYDLGVKGIADDIRRGRLKLEVEYQRKYVWDQGKASRLIESLLLNVPIPVCYFAEDESGNYEVIDGLQRLTTIRDYLNDDFGLTGVSVLRELDGLRFSDLAPRDQRRLENRTIRCIVVTEESHPDIKFDVFERLNTGAASLTAQELRNCLYRGTFNDHLKQMAEMPSFLRLMGTSSNRRMEHEELILRFLALTADLSSYRPPLRQFLNAYMRKNRANAPDPKLVEVFRETCDAVWVVLGDTVFRTTNSRRAVHKALFDAIMVSIAFADREALLTNASCVREARSVLLEDTEFLATIARATADRVRMMGRIHMFAAKLRDCGITVNLPEING
ncbi:MAG TPA: DUF262 domain-containing protein [Micromonosporaceae bacterium]